MNIINFDADKSIATIQLYTTEVQKIQRLLHFYYSKDLKQNNDGSIELYKDFFILFELLTHKKIDFCDIEFCLSIKPCNSVEEK